MKDLFEYITVHYKEIVVLTGSFTGLLGLIITFYSKYRDSAIKEKELELKKEQLALEKKYQITKETYQKLFEKKIQVYERLYSSINKFKKQLHNVGMYFDSEDAYGRHTLETLTVEDVSISTLKEVFKEIQDNHFLISNGLMKEYEKLYDLYKEHMKEFEFILDVGAYGSPDELDAEWAKVRDSFYIKYKYAIDGFFKKIEKEIEEMKKVLEY